MIRMPVYAADPHTVRTDSRRMLFYEGTQRLDRIGNLLGQFSQPGHFSAGGEERLLHLMTDAFKDDLSFMKIHFQVRVLSLRLACLSGRQVCNLSLVLKKDSRQAGMTSKS